MSTDEPKRTGFSLKRWSQRKREATHAAPEPTPVAHGPVPTPPPTSGAEARGTGAPTGADARDMQAVTGGDARGIGAPSVDAAPPPSVESLTIDSDFSSFLAPEVEEGLKRRALKQLFRDPHFNVMDGLDVYVDDYSTPDPISPETVRELVQARYIFDPPKTRVNADGVVEDVPVDDGVAPEAPPGVLAEPAPAPQSESEPGPEPDSEPKPEPESEPKPERKSMPVPMASAVAASKPVSRDAREVAPATGTPPASSGPPPR